MAFGRKSKEPGKINGSPPAPATSYETERTLTPQDEIYGGTSLPKQQIKRATRTRLIFALLTSLFLLLSTVFLVLVQIGNTYDQPVLRNTWFAKFDFTNVIPTTVPNSALINSIARTLGLHDFFTVGLWNYCEGYSDVGITDCAKPQVLYWFDPVSILQQQLLAGGSITLPQNVLDILNIIRIASHWMFGLFLSGTCLTFLMVFLTPLSVYSRWVAFFVSIFTFIAALLITAASIIATAMFIIAKNVISGVQELNISVVIGIQMFVFMWIASGFAILAWLVQTGLCCCCASRRDVKKGKKRGSKKAYIDKEKV